MSMSQVCFGDQVLLRAFARHVQSLAGRYWTAIDVGVGPDDADILAEECDYVFARASQYEAGFSHLNSPHWAGLWVFRRFRK